MTDQATELRKLVLQAMRDPSPRACPAPRLILIAGGQQGLGATTLAINLSVALAMQGARTVLVDANPDCGEIAAQLGLASGPFDMVASRLDFHEVLVRGPAGVLVVPGLWSHRSALALNEVAQHRLIQQMQRLGRHADLILLDCGHRSFPAVQRFWQIADRILLVTTPDAMSITHGYALIKRHGESLRETQLHLIVNHANSAAVAEDIHQRMAQSCLRFLGLTLSLLGRLPTDETLARGLATHLPLVRTCPDAEFTRAIEQMATECLSPDRRTVRRVAA